MTPEYMLAKLMQHFWINQGGIEWSYHEGVTLAEVDPRLNTAILEWAKQTKAAEVLFL